jgi:hypothetical protein
MFGICLGWSRVYPRFDIWGEGLLSSLKHVGTLILYPEVIHTLMMPYDSHLEHWGAYMHVLSL